MAGAGPQRKAVQYAGKYYSALGTGANQTVKSSGALVHTVTVTSGTATDKATILDNGTQVHVVQAGMSAVVMVETQTSLQVNAPTTATVSISYD